MSYADQFFGTKQNLVLQYTENLAFFGEDSYVYKNPSLMKEVIANEIALLNPTTAYYAYLWARENGYKAVDYFTKGLVIAIYNSELNATYHFVLVDYNEDGSAKFISREPCLLCAMSTSTTGIDILNYEDYDMVQYLNGEINWFDRWENKPASIPAVFPTNSNSLYKKLRTKKGFLSGFDYKLKSLLKTFKDGYNFPVLPINPEEFDNVTMKNCGYQTNFNVINENCYNFYADNAVAAIPDNVAIGGMYYGCLFEEVTADQITNRPLYRAGFGSYKGTGVYTLERVQNETTTNLYAAITHGSPINLKIQF